MAMKSNLTSLLTPSTTDLVNSEMFKYLSLASGLAWDIARPHRNFYRPKADYITNSATYMTRTIRTVFRSYLETEEWLYSIWILSID